MVVVTGASGFIGSHLLMALKENDIEFKALARSIPSQEELEKQGYKTVFGDVTEANSLESAFDGCSTVVHLAGTLRDSKDHSFDDVNRLGTRNVVQVAKKKGVKKLIYLSSTAAFPDSANPYLLSKWGAEEEIKSSKTNYTIIKTSFVYGPGSKTMRNIARIIKRWPLVPLINGGMSQIQPVYISDFIGMLVPVIDSEPPNKGVVFEFGGMERIDFMGFLKNFAVSMRKKRRFVSVPYWLLKPFIFAWSKVSGNAPVTPVEADLFTYDHIADNGDLENKEDVQFVPLRDGLRRSVDLV